VMTNTALDFAAHLAPRLTTVFDSDSTGARHEFEFVTCTAVKCTQHWQLLAHNKRAAVANVPWGHTKLHCIAIKHVTHALHLSPER
jgi:hypothetical protein